MFETMVSPVPLSLNFLDQTLLLFPQKAIFWLQQKTLIVADVHLGKVGHFRKAGIAIPRSMEQEDLAVLSDLIREYHPSKIIFLGDLFHSDMNNDWDWFVLWRDQFKEVELILVRGNHDILNENVYRKLNFQIHKTLVSGPFLFIHERVETSGTEPDQLYIISGHIHPGVRLSGKGRQSLTLPCFHFGKHGAVMPAFGKFTGRVCLKYKESDLVFGILKHAVVAL